MRVSAEPDTETLLAQVREGDPSAAGRLLVLYASRLRQMVSARMEPQLAVRVDPSDVVQETLLVALQKLPQYVRERPLAFYPWLRQIAIDRLAELRRRHLWSANRTVHREQPLPPAGSDGGPHAEQLLADSESLLQRLVRKETLGRLRQALGTLSPQDREVLVLRHLEQLNTADTAEVLGISQTAAKQRHLRAIRRLRRILGQELLGKKQ